MSDVTAVILRPNSDKKGCSFATECPSDSIAMRINT